MVHYITNILKLKQKRVSSSSSSHYLGKHSRRAPFVLCTMKCDGQHLHFGRKYEILHQDRIYSTMTIQNGTKWVQLSIDATNKRTRERFIASWRIVTYFATWTRLRIARRAFRPSWSRSLPRHWRGPRQTTPRTVMTTRRRRIYTQMTVYSDFRYTARIHTIQEKRQLFRSRSFYFWGIGRRGLREVGVGLRFDFSPSSMWVKNKLYNLCLLGGWMSVWTVVCDKWNGKYWPLLLVPNASSDWYLDHHTFMWPSIFECFGRERRLLGSGIVSTRNSPCTCKVIYK